MIELLLFGTIFAAIFCGKRKVSGIGDLPQVTQYQVYVHDWETGEWKTHLFNSKIAALNFRLYRIDKAVYERNYKIEKNDLSDTLLVNRKTNDRIFMIYKEVIVNRQPEAKIPIIPTVPKLSDLLKDQS